MQAAEVMATLLTRVGADKAFADDQLALLRPNGSAEPLNLDERPPLVWARASLPGHRHV